jgi:hypothetical protein
MVAAILRGDKASAEAECNRIIEITQAEGQAATTLV